MGKKFKKQPKHKSRIRASFGDKAVKKHDKVNQSYLTRFKGMEIMYNNLEYMNPAKTYVVGELDGFCYRRTPNGNYAYIIETKGTMNPALKSKAKSQLERAVKRFIPLFEKRNDIHFDKVITMYANPQEIKKIKVYERPKGLEQKIGDERLQWKQESENTFKYIVDRLQYGYNPRHVYAVKEISETHKKAIKDYYQAVLGDRGTRRW